MLNPINSLIGNADSETAIAWYGTKLHWAEQAYLNVVFKPAERAIVLKVSQELDFPAPLVDLYSIFNGGSFFRVDKTCTGLVVAGCLEKDQSFSRSAESQAIDIRTLNRRNQSFVAFAGYGFDASSLVVDKVSGRVNCWHGRESMRIRKSWESLDSWLKDEFHRMGELFSKDGTCLTNCEGLLPSSSPLQ
jgi:hypothetical protein